MQMMFFVFLPSILLSVSRFAGMPIGVQWLAEEVLPLTHFLQ